MKLKTDCNNLIKLSNVVFLISSLLTPFISSNTFSNKQNEAMPWKQQQCDLESQQFTQDLDEHYAKWKVLKLKKRNASADDDEMDKIEGILQTARYLPFIQEKQPTNWGKASLVLGINVTSNVIQNNQPQEDQEEEAIEPNTRKKMKETARLNEKWNELQRDKERALKDIERIEQAQVRLKEEEAKRKEEEEKELKRKRTLDEEERQSEDLNNKEEQLKKLEDKIKDIQEEAKRIEEQQNQQSQVRATLSAKRIIELDDLTQESRFETKENELAAIKRRLDHLSLQPSIEHHILSPEEGNNEHENSSYFKERRRKALGITITEDNKLEHKDFPDEFTLNFTTDRPIEELPFQPKADLIGESEYIASLKHTKELSEENTKSNNSLLPLSNITNSSSNESIAYQSLILTLNETGQMASHQNQSTANESQSNTNESFYEETAKLLSKKQFHKKRIPLQKPLSSSRNDLLLLNVIKIFLKELQQKYSAIDDQNKSNPLHYPYLTDDKLIRCTLPSLASIIKYFYEMSDIAFLLPKEQSEMIAQFESELLWKQNELFLKQHITPILLTNPKTRDIETVMSSVLSNNRHLIDRGRIREVIVNLLNHSPLALIDPRYKYDFELYGIQEEEEYDAYALAYERYVSNKKHRRLNAFNGIPPGEGRRPQRKNETIDSTPLVNTGSWPIECKDNFYQSPISIAKPFISEAFNLNLNFSAPRPGDTVLLSKDEYKLSLKGNFGSIRHGSDYYEADVIDFHVPSEHTFDDDELRADMEMQIILKDRLNQPAVMSILFSVANKSSSFLEAIGFTSNSTSTIALSDSQPLSISNERFAALNLSQMIKKHPTYATYIGSMTSPPCLGKVKWFVLFNDRLPLTLNQLTSMKQAFGKESNVRGLQPLNGRPIRVI